MRTFLFIIGIVLIVGGFSAVRSPKDFTRLTTGPDPVDQFGSRDVIDHVTKERAVVTGYVTMFLGVGACAAGFLMKGLKAPEPHDNAA